MKEVLRTLIRVIGVSLVLFISFLFFFSLLADMDAKPYGEKIVKCHDQNGYEIKDLVCKKTLFCIEKEWLTNFNRNYPSCEEVRR